MYIYVTLKGASLQYLIGIMILPALLDKLHLMILSAFRVCSRQHILNYTIA